VSVRSIVHDVKIRRCPYGFVDSDTLVVNQTRSSGKPRDSSSVWFRNVVTHKKHKNAK